MQPARFPADANRVAGVGAPLITGHDRRLLGEDIDELALALVSPLSAHDGDAADEGWIVLPAPGSLPRLADDTR